MEKTPLGVSEAVSLINQTLDYAYPVLVVEGEVASFKVNQNKYVFFDLKDEAATLGCFMSVYNLRIPIEDGMRIQVIAQPKLTAWGKFSLTVREIKPIGAGTIKRSFELLKVKLEQEGLFSVDRKRMLPQLPARVGVISSTGAAGYGDFIKILDERWGGLELVVAHVQVQGSEAADQIIHALNHLNQLADPVEVIAIIRGGGSADDLSTFNDELLIRAIAASRTPAITGVGHEMDISLSDLVADVRAATPSNAAQLICPDRHEFDRHIDHSCKQIILRYETKLGTVGDMVDGKLSQNLLQIEHLYSAQVQTLADKTRLLHQLDPRHILRQGYSLLRNEEGKIIARPVVGDVVTVETKNSIIRAGVQDVNEK